MKKFRFQLETLLKVTRMKKDDAEVKFAEASRKLEEARRHLNQLMLEMQRGQADYESLSDEGKRVTVARLMEFNTFFAWKRGQIEQQNKVIMEAQAERQKRLKELMEIMSGFKQEGKSILFITHKLSEIMAVADRCSVLRKGKYMGTADIADTTREELSRMMVGRDVEFEVKKKSKEVGDVILSVENMVVASKAHENNAVKGVSFEVHAGEIVCIAGIEGNGQTELIHGLTGLEPLKAGKITLCGRDITNASIRERSKAGMSHIPEDRHKHGLVLDYTLEQNMVLQRYWEPQFQNHGIIKNGEVREYAKRLIERFDVRSGQGPVTVARSMSGGNQQKAIIAREIDKDPQLLVAVQPTRGLDVGAIEYIHNQLIAERDKGRAVLLISLELDEVRSLSDRILVIYEGEIVGDFDSVAMEELGLYMAGAKRRGRKETTV